MGKKKPTKKPEGEPQKPPDGPSPIINWAKKEFLDQAAQLWDSHEREFTNIPADAESPKAKINFTVELSLPLDLKSVCTKIRFTVQEEIKSAPAEDPNQTQLFEEANSLL